MKATIKWDGKKNELVMTDDEGRVIASVQHSEPITASTDAHSIASMFGDFAFVDHDREFIHVFAN